MKNDKKKKELKVKEKKFVIARCPMTIKKPKLDLHEELWPERFLKNA